MTNTITRTIENPRVEDLQEGDLLTFEIGGSFLWSKIAGIYTLPLEASPSGALFTAVPGWSASEWYVRHGDGALAAGNQRLIKVEREVALPCEVSFGEIKVGDRVERVRTFSDGTVLTANFVVEVQTRSTLHAECGLGFATISRRGGVDTFTLLERPGPDLPARLSNNLLVKQGIYIDAKDIKHGLEDAGLELVRKEIA